MEEKKKPEGWVTTALDDVANWGSGGTPSRKMTKFYTGSIPWIKTGELGPKEIKFSEEHITEEAIKKSSAKVFPKGSVGIAMYGATIGKLSIWGIDASTNQACAVAKPHNLLLSSEFLYYFLSSEKRRLVEAGKGGAQPNISQGVLKEWPIFLPPYNEQHRIVTKIEKLFSELDKGIESLKTARAQLKVYRQAVLKHAFEGKLTAKWREKNKDKLETADQLLARIQKERKARYQQQLKKWEEAVRRWEANGKDGKKPARISKPKTMLTQMVDDQERLPSTWIWSNFCSITYKIGDIDHKMPNRTENGYPYLSTGDLSSDGTMDFSNAKLISEKDYERLALKIRPEKGDVIFPRYGTIGRNILVDIDKKFLVSYSCAIIKNITSLMKEKYVYYFSLSPITTKEIKRYVKETTQANIGIASIEQFIFPLCSYEEQSMVVDVVESQLSMLDQQEKQIEESLIKIGSLRQSILKKAFSGQLVAQDPNDEPASVLLERIRAEKENPPQSPFCKGGRSTRKSKKHSPFAKGGSGGDYDGPMNQASVTRCREVRS